MLLCAHVSFGGSLAEVTTWTKRIVEKKSPKLVGKNSEGRFCVYFQKMRHKCHSRLQSRELGSRQFYYLAYLHGGCAEIMYSFGS